MLGHGRPPTATLIGIARASIALGLLCGLANLRTHGAPPPAEPPAPSASTTNAVAAPAAPKAASVVSLNLRFEWGGGTAQPYAGTIEMVDGKVSHPHVLGLEVDEPGSMYIEDERLKIEPRADRVYDGVDVTIAGPADGKLLVTLQCGADRNAAPVRVEVPLLSILHDTFHAPLNDGGGNRISVRRAPGDRLRVRYVYNALIFKPGELMQVELQPHLLGLAPAAQLRLTASLQPARQAKSLWSDSIDVTAPLNDGDWNRIPLSLRLPDAEGVYDVVLELQQPSLTTRLNLTAPIERRRIQFVVLSPQPAARPQHGEAPQPSVLMEIDPASPGWWDRTKALTATTIPSLKRGPLGNCKPALRRSATGTYTELPPSKKIEPSDSKAWYESHLNLAWQAYPIPVAQPGQPHILEIEYPSDVAQSLGISLVEPNAAGAVTPIGVDSGLFLDEGDVERVERKLTRRIVVWPQTATPLIVVMNRRRDAPAVYGKLRLLGSRAPSIVALPWGAREAASLPHAHLPEARADGRLLAAYYDRPLFPENFSSGPTLDGAGGESARCLDDWVTFYEGSRRLVEYLTYVGYNGAMITAAADGSAIYPSRHFESTPRYDDGIFFADGQDPTRKDVLELLMRMFDREGLRLIPAVQFASRLPQLEAVRRDGLRTLGVDPLRPQRAAPRTMDVAKSPYDPLKPRVEQEMTAILAELNQRYGTHSSFAGVAIQLSPDGYTQHFGSDWGADSDTLRSFAQETNLNLPANLSARDLAVAVVDDHRTAWLAWRAEKVARLYGRLHAAIAKESSRRLYLVAAHAWESRDAQARLQPTLGTPIVPEQALLESGLDPVRLSKVPGVVWMRSYVSKPVDALVDQGAMLELNRSEAMDKVAAEQPWPTSLIFYEPQSARLDSLEKQSPYQPIAARFFTHALPGAGKQRRAMVHQLAALDTAASFQGGWLLPLGEEDDMRKLAGVLRALPAEKFATVPSGRTFVTIRTLTRDDRTYYYLVNDAPWPATVTLDMTASPNTVWRGFGSGAAQTGWISDDTGRKWQAKLEPYDVVGGMFLEPNVAASQPRIEVADEVSEMLTKRIRDLWLHTANIQRASSFVRIVNPGFEPTVAKAMPSAPPTAPATGWRHVAGDGGLKIETVRQRSGVQCALFVSGESGGAIQSDPITVGPSGRVALSVWLRKASTEQPRLRLAFEGRLIGSEEVQSFYRFASVGGGPNAAPLDHEWRQFLFQVHDLPTTGLADLRIRFELSGPGEVLLDDVAVTDLDFTDAERLELSKVITLAEFKLQKGEIGECARLLDGYWPRFLRAYVPTAATDGSKLVGDGSGTGEQTGVPSYPQTNSGGEVPLTARAPAPAAPAAEPAPGIRDRMRRFVPDWLR
ncbi:MAG: family 10 glycosylhydrolase [Planctomycetia bacterium]|nr:family 10 glycosylhydrolase [Planctomycetia bacterium]